MHVRKLLFLLLAVGALVGVWALRRGEPVIEGRVRRLFEGVDPARVVALRIDNVERALQLELERDSAGRWSITDPVAYPADDGVVKILMEVVRTSQGVERPDVDPAAAGFDPPRAILEAIELVDGERRRTAVQLGAVDVSSNRCWARQAGGVPLLTLRTLDTALDRTPDQYRERRIALVRPDEIVEVHRRGAYPFGPGKPAQELGFDAQLEGGVWRTAVPERARLDPTAFGLLLQGLTTMRVEHFHDDSLDDLASYGLDEPLLRLEIVSASGGRMALLFALDPSYPDDGSPAEDRVWLAMREGFPFVWEVYGRDVRLLSSPLDALLDYRLTGGRREPYTELVLGTAAGGALRLARDGERWSLATSDAGAPPDPGRGGADERAWSAPLPAADGPVEDLLLALESAELSEWLPGARFADDEVAAWFVARSRTGDDWRGELGPAYEAPGGARGRLYRRERGGAVFLAADDVLALLGTDPESLRSLLVHRLEETQLRRLELTSAGGETRRWVRAEDGRWFRADEPETEARELWDVLDGLLALRAERWLDADADPLATAPLEQPLEVTFVDRAGAATRFTVGLAGPAGTEVVLEGGRAAVVSGVHARLAELLGG